MASQRLKDFLKRKESLRLKAYLCPAKVWTCGWGHTSGVTATTTCTYKQAERWLDEDLDREEAVLRHIVKVPLTTGQTDALLSLSFNLKGGAAALPQRAPKLMRKLNAGDYTGCATEFLDIVKANGQVLDGLVTRRREEFAMFIETPAPSH